MTAFARYERRHKESRWTKRPRYSDRMSDRRIATPRLSSAENDRFCRIVLKKSKVERLRKSREDRVLVLQASVGQLRRSVIAFVGIDVVPPVAAHRMH